jgi:hypothetical protein
MAVAPELARKANGDVRLDYSVGGAGMIRVWEPRGPVALETTFRSDGAVLLQNSIETAKIESRVSETLAEAGAEGPLTAPYREVGFDRACPWCSKHALVRFAEAYRSKGEVPIVPLYHCRECKGHSYYITDEYLVHLIASNPDKFEPKDVERFRSEQAAFVSEIKAYIISSFASKRVKRID